MTMIQFLFRPLFATDPLRTAVLIIGVPDSYTLFASFEWETLAVARESCSRDRAAPSSGRLPLDCAERWRE
jgi:hypothetical protein